jgi:hypothetical protein
MRSTVAAKKGSQRRLQEWIDWRAGDLDRRLSAWPSLSRWRNGDLTWLSPLREHGFAELRDDLWDKAGLPCPTPQEDGFWPRRGPAWDAVATVPRQGGQHGVLLVEAKSHKRELLSPATQAGDRSREMIRSALDATKAHLEVAPEAEWTENYYQIANRLAFLYYLRVRRALPAWLLSIYFVGDSFESGGRKVIGPSDIEGWRAPIRDAEATLMLPDEHPLSPFTWRLFLPADPEDRLVECVPTDDIDATHTPVDSSADAGEGHRSDASP